MLYSLPQSLLNADGVHQKTNSPHGRRGHGAPKREGRKERESEGKHSFEREINTTASSTTAATGATAAAAAASGGSGGGVRRRGAEAVASSLLRRRFPLKSYLRNI